MNQPDNLEFVPVENLIPYARNSRTHSDAQVAQIAASIKEFGFTNPVLIDEADGIIAGHGRLLAARKLGMAEVPCLRLGYLSEIQKRAYVIADNKLALNSGWDDEMLALEFSELADLGFDLDLTGFSPEEIDGLTPKQIEEGLTDEDAVPELPQEPVTKVGDVWILGNHRLMCGDSTSMDAVDKLMNGQKADMMFTDPPYGFNYVKKSDGQFIQNDGDEFAQIIHDAITNVQVDTSYICGDAKTAKKFLDATSVLGEPKNCIVWVKPIQHRMHRYEPCHEFIWYWGDNGNPFYGANVFECKREINKFHPTIKPIELIEFCLKSHKDKKTVIDLFGGSGSTMLACEKQNRHARLMELEPKYCDVIVKRWQDFTGKIATHAETGESFSELTAGVKVDHAET
jgi:DNA modification methylase